MRRQVTTELLDSNQGTTDEVSESLRDLDRVNLLFGGISSYIHLLRRIADHSGRRKLSLLDVGSGSGYLPISASDRLRKNGVSVQVTLLDRVRNHMPRNGVPLLVGDALEMPVSDGSFDVVSCSLFLHHLDPEQVLRFAAEALRVARVAVLISDLIRSRMHLLLTYLGFPLLWSRLSRHDGPASVRRAYTIPEARELLSRSSAAQIEIQHLYLCRMGVLLWKEPAVTT